jgi:hypothetical protein
MTKPNPPTTKPNPPTTTQQANLSSQPPTKNQPSTLTNQPMTKPSPPTTATATQAVAMKTPPVRADKNSAGNTQSTI